MVNTDQIAVLIPCYNEEKTIAKVVADFRRVLPEAVIYVYDNNSTVPPPAWPGRPAPLCAVNISRERET